MKFRSPLIICLALTGVQGFAQSSSNSSTVVQSSGGSFYSNFSLSPSGNSFSESSTGPSSTRYPYSQIKSNGIVDLYLPGSNADLGPVKLDWQAAFLAQPQQLTAQPGSFTFYGQNGSSLLTYSYSSGQLNTIGGTHFTAHSVTLTGPVAQQYHLPTAVNIDFYVFHDIQITGGARLFHIGDASFVTTQAVPEPFSLVGIGALAPVVLLKRKKKNEVI